jgi:hypothetical protein
MLNVVKKMECLTKNLQILIYFLENAECNFRNVDLVGRLDPLVGCDRL